MIGLLQDPVRVLVLLELVPDRAELGVENLNIDAALVCLDQLARRLVLRFIESDLDLAQFNGELGAQLVLVGLNVGQRHGHGRLEPAGGQLDRAVPQGRGEHEG